MRLKYPTSAVTLALALALSGGSAQAQKTLHASNWLAPAHILNEFVYQKWAADVAAATGGKLKIEVHSSGSLVPAPATMQGIRDGVAQVGIVFPGYTPSEQPLNNVVNDLVFVSDDDIAAAFAYTELGLTNAKIQAEWAKNGGLFAGGYATPVYHFICVKPIRTLADARGLKIRTAGGAQTNWVRSLGAVPVSVPIGDVYSGLERGSIDCTLSDPTNLDKGNKFWEVAKSVNRLPMGVVIGANYIWNRDEWRKLPVEQRRILLDTMAVGSARAQVAYHVGVNAAIDGSKQRGLEIIAPSADLSDKLTAFNRDFVANLPKSSVEARKVADPSDVVKAFSELEAKWKGLLKNVDRTNPDAVAALLKQHLYSKIDEKTFGMN
jgi:TRAP-type C4-dicarboxylate transport system substrate-binding protein